jgi:cold shock CspA family protein
MFQGEVMTWNLKGGYGFIFSKSFDRQIFFHRQDWRSPEQPTAGVHVTFDIGPGRAGKPNAAKDVTLVHAGLDALKAVV